MGVMSADQERRNLPGRLGREGVNERLSRKVRTTIGDDPYAALRSETGLRRRGSTMSCGGSSNGAPTRRLNPSMPDQLLHAPEGDRRDVYNAASAALGIPDASIEKDAWICWTLDVLFSSPSALLMAFKGGTGWLGRRSFRALSAIPRCALDSQLDRSGLGPRRS